MCLCAVVHTKINSIDLLSIYLSNKRKLHTKPYIGSFTTITMITSATSVITVTIPTKPYISHCYHDYHNRCNDTY